MADKSRRGFLQGSAFAALAAMLGGIPEMSFGGDQPSILKITWTETPPTISLTNQMKPALEKFKAERNVHALTPDEWDRLGNQHQALWDLHAKLGNLHKTDLCIQANQTYLKRHFNATDVDYIMEQGTYALFTKASAGFHDVANKLRGNEPELLPYGCAQFWESMATAMFLLAFIVAGPFELVVALTLLGFSDEFMGQFLCQ